MADVLLTINGIGQGHLMRGLNLCRWLRRSGRRPLVMHQGSYPDAIAKMFPGVNLPTVYKLNPELREQIREQLVEAAQLSSPALVIEDTHPVELDLPDEIVRLLVVRPTVMEHMRMLYEKYQGTYKHFLICDHPGSPTWPYGPEETREILEWERFECLGPIYRRSTVRGVASIQRRYGFRSGQPILVFSLGGGGEKPGSGDRERFLVRAEQVAKEYRLARPEARCFFVCGPLFPDSHEVPAIFERIQQEPEFPSLLACATGAVIRPGYNAIWECIAAGTPFLPLLGTTYMEPTDLRIEAMRRSGIQMVSTVAELDDHGFRTAFISASRQVTERFSGCPQARFLEIVEALTPVHPKSNLPRKTMLKDMSYSAARCTPSLEKVAVEGCQLMLQLDHVTGDDEHLRWLAEILRQRNLYLSLAVVPYLSRLSRAFLDEIDPDRRFSLSMHGFCHLRRGALSSPAAEFTELGNPQEWIQRWQLELGFRLMRFCYRERFHGNFSAPFDSLPSWLLKAWADMGGTHISANMQSVRPDNSAVLGMIGMSHQGDPQETHTVLESISQSFHESGRGGVVFDRRLLMSEAGRLAIESLLDAILARHPRCNGIQMHHC